MSAATADSFDYVVVGGGLAGLVVAARLVEDPKKNVAVLEAGGHVAHWPDVQIPGMYRRNLMKPEIDWGFSSPPQPAVNNRSLYLPRGKGLGGSSVLNFMSIGRASAEEYNAFERLGLKGWNWEELAKYFVKSETFHLSPEMAENYNLAFDPKYQGTSGPLKRSIPRWISDLQSPFYQALHSTGVPSNSDNCSGNTVGTCIVTNTVDPESVTRSSSASAYYEPNKDRKNLQVLINSRATRVIFAPTPSGSLRAEAVEYSKDGTLHTIHATREVVLCAGAFQTPQLLELSGIGNENILKEHSIPVLLNLPGVGTNLRSLFTAEVDPKYETMDVLVDPARAAEELKLYQTKKEGMFSGTASVAYAFLPTKYFADAENLRNTIAEPDPSKGQITAGILKLFNIEKDWLSSEKVPQLEVVQVPAFYPAKGATYELGKRYFTIFLALLHPFSRGTVHIASADPLTNPIIDPMLLSNPVDLDILVAAVKYARKIASTDVLRPLMGDEVIPGPHVQSDDQLKEFIKDNLSTVFHPVGTAAMMPLEDGGVVDENLKVYGTDNLRVVDASIIPIQIGAHTQGTVYAIAEKAADIIKASSM